MAKSRSGRDNPRWQRRREQILSAAARLFRKRGYLATTMEDISGATKLNKAAIYYYFKNKTTILFEIGLASMSTLLALAEPVEETGVGPQEKLTLLVKKHLDWALTNIGTAGLGQLEMRNLTPKGRRLYIAERDKYEAVFRRVIKQGIEQGVFREIEPKLASLFILGLLNSMVGWYRQNGRLSAKQIAAEASEFILSALKA